MSDSPNQSEGALVAFLADRDVVCPACATNLRAVSRDACPECGHALHLRELLGVLAADQPPPRRNHAPLGHRAARGFAWLFGQHVIDRVLFAVQGIVLAWLLSRETYDLIALAFTVTSFAGLLQQAGLSQVLVQRHARFRLWCTPVFWLALTSGICIGGIVAAISPLVAWFYGREELTGLLLVAAASMPLSSLAVVPDARLRGDLRFRAIALVSLINAVGTVSLSIFFAWRGLGAYSLVLPQPIMLCLTLSIQWWLARPRIGARPQFRRWRYLLSHSAMLLVAQVAMMTTYQGGQLVLGRMHRTQPYAGTFYFALNFSDQSTRLLVWNLSSVLFPTLSRLRDETMRQTQAFLNACRVLLLVGVPCCLLQAALAGPLIRVCFPTRWEPTIVPFAVLSMSMIGRLIYGPSESMLLAQRRIKLLMVTAVIYAIGYLTAVFVGAASAHPVEGAATAVTMGILTLTPIMMRMAVAPGGGTWADVGRAYRAPLLAGLAAFAPSAAIVLWIAPRTIGGDIASLVMVPITFMAIYISLIRRFAMQDWLDVVARVRPLAQRVKSAARRSMGRA